MKKTRKVSVRNDGVARAAAVNRARELAAKQARTIAKADQRDVSTLKAMTKKSRAEWMQLVNGAIAKASRPSADPDHGETNTLRWLGEVARAVHGTFPKNGRYDGNMRAAMLLSVVLGLWYSRVQRAKAYDPRRPVVQRRAALARWRAYWHEMFDAAVNEVDDATVFSGQHWDPPWSPHAIDGVFL